MSAADSGAPDEIGVVFVGVAGSLLDNMESEVTIVP